MLFSFTSTAGVDYIQTVSPMLVTLSNDTRLNCTTVSIIEDDLVEGQEMFIVSFDVSDAFGMVLMH